MKQVYRIEWGRTLMISTLQQTDTHFSNQKSNKNDAFGHSDKVDAADKFEKIEGFSRNDSSRSQ